MKPFSQLFFMNGYGTYIWLAYGMAVLVLLLNVMLPMLRLGQIKQKIKIRYQRG